MRTSMPTIARMYPAPTTHPTASVWRFAGRFRKLRGMRARLPAHLSILRPHNMLASALAVVAGNSIARGGMTRDVVVTAALAALVTGAGNILNLSLIHISEPTRLLSISYAVFC